MLIVAAALDFAVAALHAAAVVVGAPAYRFLRAGEAAAHAAETGKRWPALLTAALSALFALWGACTLSAAGALPPLPRVRWAVGLIATVYIGRGLALIPEVAGRSVVGGDQRVERRDLVFSAASLAIGGAHALALWTERSAAKRR